MKLSTHRGRGRWGQRSPPSRGAWIEINILSEKYTENPVAPLAGGVD